MGRKVVRRKQASDERFVPDNMPVVEAALYWASQGIAVFPCSGDKRPLTKNGFKDAVKDAAEVKQLFEFYGQSAKMVGAAMGDVSGMFAIDFDLYKGPEVDAWMRQLIDKDLLPNSRIHKTMRGGLHIFYNGKTLPQSSYPVDGVEVRGNGAYVIFPGGGAGYSVIQEGIIPAPSALLKYLASIKREQAGDTVDGLKAKILAADNFHDSLARLAARYSAMGWDQETVTASIMGTLKASVASEPSHPRHERWQFLMKNESGEFLRTITTAHKKYNSQAARDEFTDRVSEEAFAKMRETAAAAFKEVPTSREEEEHVYGDEEWPFEGEGYFAHVEHDVFDAKYVVYPVLVEDESVLIAADPKAGKTAILLTLGLHLATGRDLGPSLRVEKPRGVLYFGLEGRRAIRLRIEAWKRNLRELGETIPDNIPLFVVERSKNLLQEDARKRLILDVMQYEKQLERVYGVSLGLITFDTLTKAMPGGDQNSVEDTSLLFDVVNSLRDVGCRATVCFLHHKARAGHVRGSTNIEADVDTITSVYKEGENHVWSIDRARSIEEGASFHFRFSSYNFGVSPQGFNEKSFVVTPVDAAIVGASGISDAMGENKVAGMIIALGKGTHPLETLQKILGEAGLAPMTAKMTRGKPRIATWSSPAAQEFYGKLVPEKGWAFAGYTMERVMRGEHIHAIHIF